MLVSIHTEFNATVAEDAESADDVEETQRDELRDGAARANASRSSECAAFHAASSYPLCVRSAISASSAVDLWGSSAGDFFLLPSPSVLKRFIAASIPSL